MTVVLDSSALIAHLLGEPGGDEAADAFGDAVISAVNFAEVISKLVGLGMPSSEAVSQLQWLDVDIVPADAEDAALAGELRATTKRAGLSLGDRFCLALAVGRGLPVLTADQAWAGLDLGVEIQLMR